MSKKKPRKSKGVIEADLCDLLSGSPPAALKKAPEFPYDFIVVRGSRRGAPVILRRQENEAEIVVVDYVAGDLRQYLSRLSAGLEAYNVPFDTCVRVVKAWSHQVAHLDELPKAVAFKSDPALTMARLPFDPKVIGLDELKVAAPFFCRILTRLSNADAFVMRIGSFYDPVADRKQAVWVSGPGDSGKSVLPWLIDRLLPGATSVLSNDVLTTQFWKASVVGKRVAQVQEAAAMFIRTSAFKSLTGDAVHLINQKIMPLYSARLDVMLMFYSNEAPEIPRDDALIKRIIDCRMAPIPPTEAVMTDAEIRARLEPELPYIAGYCVGRYIELAPGSRIPCSIETLDDAISSFEGDYLAELEAEFVAAEPDAEGRDKAHPDLAAYLCRTEFIHFCTQNGHLNRKDQSILKRILKTNFGVRERKLVFETNAPGVSKRLYVYWGVRRRTQEERQFFRPAASGTVLARPRPGSRLQVVE